MTQPQVIESVDAFRSSFEDPARPRPVRVYLLIARDRALDWVGAAGFSAGGYAAAALVGVRLDQDLVRLFTDGEIPEPPMPEFPEAFATVRRTTAPEAIDDVLASAGADHSDDRVRAAFLICPGDAGLASAESLHAVSRPVAIRWAGADVITPPEQTALRWLELIPGAQGESLGPDVEHHHLFPGDSQGTEARTRAAAGAVDFLTRAAGLERRS